jgi:hypothetical protein
LSILYTGQSPQLAQEMHVLAKIKKKVGSEMLGSDSDLLSESGITAVNDGVTDSEF